MCWGGGTLYCAASTEQLKEFRLYSSLLLCVTLEKADSRAEFAALPQGAGRAAGTEEHLNASIGKVYKYSVQFV